ncbi:hypothetical protein SNOG_14056 [Parastagonospora nodorum SN15]|uniref:Uncharacterized protein n=1 Tax=Phaeosphaeria nodorum (strain SN15 / ATCC MYA-4574 / FGSC 10173) TaxID=321614 RepID=Q0U2H7_PHANO|nr:hypothetical protein SNOG_14056 [Parastagonospora nodorum SN15]EAT78681.1 hypothetical protein SNOG_14056 [Parastagonospora nodorum SN15]
MLVTQDSPRCSIPAVLWLLKYLDSRGNKDDDAQVKAKENPGLNETIHLDPKAARAPPALCPDLATHLLSSLLPPTETKTSSNKRQHDDSRRVS